MEQQLSKRSRQVDHPLTLEGYEHCARRCMQLRQLIAASENELPRGYRGYVMERLRGAGALWTSPLDPSFEKNAFLSS